MIFSFPTKLRSLGLGVRLEMFLAEPVANTDGVIGGSTIHAANDREDIQRFSMVVDVVINHETFTSWTIHDCPPFFNRAGKNDLARWLLTWDSRFPIMQESVRPAWSRPIPTNTGMSRNQ